jgi:hypothetical protein
MQPPVVIPSPSLACNRPQRSHSRHGSISSASERPEIVNGFDLSHSDDQNGADAESHRSTLRPPPKPYPVSSQNFVPPSPRGSRKQTEPRNGSPARSNPRSRSPFLPTDRSSPHSPDLRRGRPNHFTTHPQPRANQPSPERSRPGCNDRSRLEVPGDVPRIDERTPGKRKFTTGKKDIEASKLNREPSWVMVDQAQEATRLPRVGPKSSSRYQASNSTLSRSHGIPHIPRQQPAPSPGGDRESRGSGRQAVPPGWAVQWKPASGDPSSPNPPYNLKMAKSMDNLREKGAGRSRPIPVPPLPLTPPLGNSSQSKDGTPNPQLVNGDAVGSSSQREVNLPPPNDPPKRQVEPSRPFLRTSPTNSRPIRPLPQQTPGQPLPEVAVTIVPPLPRLPFPQSPPTGLATSTSSTPGLLPAQSDPISRPRSVLDEESLTPPPPPPHLPRLRPVDSSVFSEPLQETDMLRSPLPNPHPPRLPPRQLPPPVSREDSGPPTASRTLPIPGRTPAMDDRSPDIRPSSLTDGNPTPTHRTPPRSPISPRSPWDRFGTRPDLSAAASADVSRSHGQSRDLIDFNKPAEQTVVQDDKTLRAIQHLLDGQSSSDEATMMVKPKTTFVLPPIPPPPPLQTMLDIGYVPPPPPLPKPPAPSPIPIIPTPSDNTLYSPPTPVTPDSQPSDQDGSDSEAGTLWQKPMIEEDTLADRPKSGSRGPPLTVKIDEQFGGSPIQASQTRSSTSSGGGLTLIPNNFPPPPKHPPPSPPLPLWGTRSSAARQANRKPSKSEFQDSSWASRPNPEEVINKLEVWFPDHDLDKPVIEASSGGTSPTAAEYPPAPLPYNGKPADKRSRHKKSIRVVAEEHNLRQDRTSRLQSSLATNVFRKRSTKLWDSRVEEVTPGQITSGMPPIPDSPSTAGSGTSAPKRSFLFISLRAGTVTYIMLHSHIQVGPGRADWEGQFWSCLYGIECHDWGDDCCKASRDSKNGERQERLATGHSRGGIKT